jgi:hypothetical protein
MTFEVVKAMQAPPRPAMDALGGDFALKPGKRQQDVQRQSAHGGGGVELLGDRDEGHTMLIEQLDAACRSTYDFAAAVRSLPGFCSRRFGCRCVRSDRHQLEGAREQSSDAGAR